MTILVTGAAGFIGSAVSLSLLQRDDKVVGIDSINDYYDIGLKKARLNRLEEYKNFSFFKADLCDFDSLREVFDRHGPFKKVVHLAAEAGVRHSQQYPRQVVTSNINGHVHILELCRYTDAFEHLVFASSSSIYSQDEKLPYSVNARVDKPVSVYAATKAADELISHVYSDNFNMPQTALRYFTVYGPWGRPDMAYYKFTNAIFNSEPIDIFNYGDMQRDFTYIDDVANGTVQALDHPPKNDEGSVPIRAFNIGADDCRTLMELIELLEKNIGIEAIKNFIQGPRGEMLATAADVESSKQSIGYSPQVGLEAGVEQFVNWYRQYHNCP